MRAVDAGNAREGAGRRLVELRVHRVRTATDARCPLRAVPSRNGGSTVVDGPAGAEPQARDVPLPNLRWLSSGAFRPCPDHAGRRLGGSASRPYRVRPEGARGRSASDDRGVACAPASQAWPLGAGALSNLRQALFLSADRLTPPRSPTVVGGSVATRRQVSPMNVMSWAGAAMGSGLGGLLPARVKSTQSRMRAL
jgi:hypothetical protein